MNITGKRIIQKITAMFLVFVITMAEFSLVGQTAISYAIDAIKTNNENVEFFAYFENAEGERITSVNSQLEDQGLKLKADVSVSNNGLGGYFEGELQLNDANFKFKDDKPLSVYVNAGETKTFEKEIEFLNVEELPANYLTKNSIVRLTGKYINSQKEYEINGDSFVNVNWVSDNDISAELNAKILTNYTFKENNENKTLLQVLVKSNLKNNSYPVKATKINIEMLEEASEVKVEKWTTAATNGDKEFTEENYEYNNDNGILTINVQNSAENEMINWIKEAEDLFVVTYKFDGEVDLKATELKVNSIVTSYDEKELNNKIEIEVKEKINGVVSGSIIEHEDSIYKGKIYAGEERIYTSTTQISINDSTYAKEISVDENKAIFISEKNIDANIKYIQTKINKNEFLNVLGNDGYITIQDESDNVIANITKNTETDNDGNVVVNYSDNIQALLLNTSKPIANGQINFEHMKSISKNNYTRSVIEKFIAIKESAKIQNIEITNKILLKETESQLKLELQTTSLSTSEDKQALRLRATLLSSDETDDLYKNPKVTIALPKEIKDIEASCKLLYGNGLKIKSAKLAKVNNENVITVNLEGEQKSYSGETVDGAIIDLYGITTVDKLAATAIEKVKLNYSNENALTYADNGQQEQDIKINNENSIILLNKIEEFNYETIGNEESKEIKLDVNNKIKEATVQIQIKNNEGADVKDILIKGKLPSIEGKIKLKEVINVSKNVDIYYTNIAEPTVSIDDATNGWTKTFSQDAKYFLISLNELKNAEAINISYKLDIAEKLEYNLKTDASYELTYTNSAISKTESIKSSTVTFATGGIAEIGTELIARVGDTILKDNDIVKSGEIIKYSVNVVNNGTEDVEGINIESIVPDGTKLLKINPEYTENRKERESNELIENVEEIPYYIELEDKKVVYENITIKAKEVLNFTYIVRVNSDIQDNQEILAKCIVNYKEEKDEVELKNIAKKSPFLITLFSPDICYDNNILKSRGKYTYKLSVSNLYNENQEVSINANYNEFVKPIEAYYRINDDFVRMVPVQDNVKVTIPAKQTITLYMKFEANQPEDENSMANVGFTIKDSSNNTYSSDVLSNKVDGVMANITLSSVTESKTGYVKPGDKISYTVTVKNKGKEDENNLIIEDLFSNYLNIEKIIVNGEESINYENISVGSEKDNCSTLKIKIPTKANSSSEVKIFGIVRKEILTKEILKIVNKTSLYDLVDTEDGEREKFINETTENVYYIEPNVKESSQDNPNDSNDLIIPDDPSNPNNTTYIITGVAWLDQNENGMRDSDEKLLKDITVYAIDVVTNKVISQTKTDENGFYSLTKLLKGKYIVAYEYNTEKYMTTIYQADGVGNDKNSDAIYANIKINGESKNVGVTDTITLNASIANIDIGLVEAKVFDLELGKYISRIVVINKSGTKTYEFDDVEMAKVEIASKYLSGSNVVIDYKIKIKNNGEMAGYVKNVVDYMPTGLIFNSTLNPDWYQSGSYIYNDSLAVTKIEAGETKELSLTLTKTMTASNTGLINNKAEIQAVYNTLGRNDIDSTPGDNDKNQDDLGTAQVIITVKTGAAVSYVMLTLTIIIVICGMAYLINKKIFKSNIKI